jgi:hypothetical protein
MTAPRFDWQRFAGSLSAIWWLSVTVLVGCIRTEQTIPGEDGSPWEPIPMTRAHSSERTEPEARLATFAKFSGSPHGKIILHVYAADLGNCLPLGKALRDIRYSSLGKNMQLIAATTRPDSAKVVLWLSRERLRPDTVVVIDDFKGKTEYGQTPAAAVLMPNGQAFVAMAGFRKR